MRLRLQRAWLVLRRFASACSPRYIACFRACLPKSRPSPIPCFRRRRNDRNAFDCRSAHVADGQRKFVADGRTVFQCNGNDGESFADRRNIPVLINGRDRGIGRAPLHRTARAVRRKSIGKGEGIADRSGVVRRFVPDRNGNGGNGLRRNFDNDAVLDRFHTDHARRDRGLVCTLQRHQPVFIDGGNGLRIGRPSDAELLYRIAGRCGFDPRLHAARFQRNAAIRRPRNRDRLHGDWLFCGRRIILLTCRKPETRHCQHCAQTDQKPFSFEPKHCYPPYPSSIIKRIRLIHDSCRNATHDPILVRPVASDQSPSLSRICSRLRRSASNGSSP